MTHEKKRRKKKKCGHVLRIHFHNFLICSLILGKSWPRCTNVFPCFNKIVAMILNEGTIW